MGIGVRILLLRPGRFKETAAAALADTWLRHARRYARIELLELTGTPHRRQRWREATGWRCEALNP